jgi:hypothetical protein
VICPTGKKFVARENLSTPARENIPLRVCPKSNLQFPMSRPTRGAYRDRHGRWAWDAMDAAVSGAIIARTNDAATYGEVVWSWRSDAGAKVAESSANDGGNQAWSPGRARRKPLKPLRREGRMIRLYLWFCRVLFVARGPWVRAGTRPSLRPYDLRAVRFQQLGHFVPRERGLTLLSTVMPRDGGASSMPRPLGSTTTASGYWIARSSPIESGTGAGRRHRRDWLFEK